MARKLKGDHGPSKRRLGWEYLVEHDFEPMVEMIKICKSTRDPRQKFDMAATIAGFFYAKPKAVEHKLVDDHKVTVTIGGAGG